MEAATAVERWFRGIPPCSRVLFAASCIVPLLVTLQLVNASWLVWNCNDFLGRAQLWRVFSPFFVASVSLSSLYSMYLRYKYASQLESEVYGSQPADFVFFLAFFAAVSAAVCHFVGVPVWWNGLTIGLVHLWSRYNAQKEVSFFYGLRFKAAYLPFAMIAIDLLMQQPIIDSLVGIVVSHLWYFVREVYPRAYFGRELLKTPQFLVRLCAPLALKSAQSAANGSFTVYAPSSGPNAKNATAASASSSSAYRAFGGKGRKLGE